jgi:hypothetical protein
VTIAGFDGGQEMAGSRCVTCFTMADANYFLGAAALVNSLVLTGHRGPIVVVDTGLEEWQRARLQPAATVLPLDAPAGLAQAFYKPFVGGSIEGDVVVYIDSDIIVTDSLDGVVELAAGGRVCAARDGQPNRFFDEWSETLPLRAPLRRETYVNAGFLAVAPARRPDFFARWQELCEIVHERSPEMHSLQLEESLIRPWAFWDQDPLNALLMSEIPAGTVAELEEGRVAASVELPDVVLEDAAALACRLGDTRTLVLHHVNAPKPWQRSGWVTASDNAYVRLLTRLLVADDVPVRVGTSEVPVWLRTTGGLRRSALMAGFHGVRRVSHAFPAPVRQRVRSFIQRR